MENKVEALRTALAATVALLLAELSTPPPPPADGAPAARAAREASGAASAAAEAARAAGEAHADAEAVSSWERVSRAGSPPPACVVRWIWRLPTGGDAQRGPHAARASAAAR
jgi:hypothetical protein